jgi:hypothetical protein
MTPKEKIAFVKKYVEDTAATNPSGPFHIRLGTVIDIEANGGIPDDAPVLLSRKEQWSIIQKLEEEGFIENIEPDDENGGIWLELAKPKTRRSNLFSYIKTTDELLQHRELSEKFLSLVKSTGEMSSKGYYKIPVDEAHDDLVQLLIDLKVVDYDWNEMQKQTHRQVGNRIIELGFSGATVLALRDRVSGRGGRIKREALELVCKDIGERFTFDKIVRFCTDLGVPETMFIHDTKWRALFYVLSYYTTSSSYEDYLLGLKIVQETLHPLMFGGDDEKAKETREKYKKWLKYNRIDIDDAGKVYVGPTDEEEELGVDEWMSVDGKTVEPKAYLIFPNRIAELWVLWSQAIVLVQAYQSNPSLDRRILEKLYLELIGKAEDLIEKGEVGKLTETYKRPFTSLATAEIEALAKGAGGPVELVSALLLKIISMNPPPQEIAKKMEEYAELIESITAATRAIGGEDINVAQLSHEQALFILKLIIGHLQKILEVACSGYLVGADEEVNAQYITLLDKLNEICEREDFSELKEKLPYVPSHLFEALDEMDVWWENGGKTSVVSFYGDIEVLWVRAGRQTFPVSQAFATYLDSVDEAVKKLNNEKAARWKRTLDDIDERKAAGEFGFAPPEPKESAPQKVVHEHTHRFENSIQEKGIDLNHKFPDSKPRGFYITKQEDDFYYKGKRLNISKNADYFKTFVALYALLPEGGEVAYADLIGEVKSRIPKLKHEERSDDDVRKFILRNLTDKGNGFLRYAGIPETEDSGKPLIEVIRGTGIAFHNKAG